MVELSRSKKMFSFRPSATEIKLHQPLGSVRSLATFSTKVYFYFFLSYTILNDFLFFSVNKMRKSSLNKCCLNKSLPKTFFFKKIKF